MEHRWKVPDQAPWRLESSLFTEGGQPWYRFPRSWLFTTHSVLEPAKEPVSKNEVAGFVDCCDPSNSRHISNGFAIRCCFPGICMGVSAGSGYYSGATGRELVALLLRHHPLHSSVFSHHQRALRDLHNGRALQSFVLH